MHCFKTLGKVVKHVLINSELRINLEAMINLIYPCDNGQLDNADLRLIQYIMGSFLL